MYPSLTTGCVVVPQNLCQSKIHIWHALSTKPMCQALDNSEFSWTECCYNVDRCVHILWSGLWHSLMWWVATSVTDEPAAPIFRVECMCQVLCFYAVLLCTYHATWCGKLGDNNLNTATMNCSDLVQVCSCLRGWQTSYGWGRLMYRSSS